MIEIYTAKHERTGLTKHSAEMKPAQLGFARKRSPQHKVKVADIVQPMDTARSNLAYTTTINVPFH